MKNGTEKLENIIKSQKKVFLCELMGSSINYSNGDYSEENWIWIENGEIAFRFGNYNNK